jgi:hypothetical protein
LLANDAVLVQLLRSALSEGYSQSLGDVATRQHPTLPWDWLQGLFDPGELNQRVVGIRNRMGQVEDARTAAALELAERYATGWRPEDD